MKKIFKKVCIAFIILTTFTMAQKQTIVFAGGGNEDDHGGFDEHTEGPGATGGATVDTTNVVKYNLMYDNTKWHIFATVDGRTVIDERKLINHTSSLPDTREEAWKLWSKYKATESVEYGYELCEVKIYEGREVLDENGNRLGWRLGDIVNTTTAYSESEAISVWNSARRGTSPNASGKNWWSGQTTTITVKDVEKEHPELLPTSTPTPGVPTATPTPGGGHVHNWKYTYKTCPKCGEEYVSEKRCACGETEEYDHICLTSTVSYEPGRCRGHCTSKCKGERKIYDLTPKPGTQYCVLSSTIYTLGGHTLAGWSTEPDGTGQFYPVGYKYVFDGQDGRLEKGDWLELYAVWEPQISTVTFDYAEETLYKPVSLTKPEISRRVDLGHRYDELGPFPVPMCFGYDFVGWYNPWYGYIIDGTETHPTTEDLTLTARWKAKTCNVTFDPNFPEDAPRDECMLFMTEGLVYPATYGKSWKSEIMGLKLAYIYAPGYEFLGWYIAGTDIYMDTDGCVGIVGDVELEARWKAKTYRYNLYTNGGEFTSEVAESFDHAIGKPFTELPTAENVQRTGFDFIGWCTDKNGNGRIYQNGDVCVTAKNSPLYALWSPHEHTVYFNYCFEWKLPADNPRGIDETSRRVKVGEPFGVLPSPSRDGYYFLGWSYEHSDEVAPHGIVREVDGGLTRVYPFTKLEGDSDVTLYAAWEPIRVDVIYDFNYDYTKEIPLP